jgi:hypothetical protein
LTGICQKEYGMSWITDWTFDGSRMELTFSIFRACKIFRICHSNVTSWCTEVENYRSYRDNWQLRYVRKSMGWAGLQTGHLPGHEWSSHSAFLGHVKFSEFVIQMSRVTTE